MFQKLVSRNGDIKRLIEKGYAVAFDSNYLIVRDVCYLDQTGSLQRGAIVTKLVFEDQTKVSQEDHQIFFAGGVPYGQNGQPIPNLGGGQTSLTLSGACSDITVQRTFSNKPLPNGKFADFYEKIESYISIIAGPAMDKFGDAATPYSYRVNENIAQDPTFKIHDTLTSRAEIGGAASKLRDDSVAIIGLGGTGAYVLDFLVKTPVKEIRAFDLDALHVHNLFRSPGRFDDAELRKPKAEVYQARYENFRSGLSCHAKYIDATSIDDLRGVTFAFVCVDKGSARVEIFDALMELGVPFIDVGMGLQRKDNAIAGMLRTTFFSNDHARAVADKGLVPLTDNADNLYKTNIQIAELNALNACLAVVKYKQIRGFYSSQQSPFHLLFDVTDLKVVGEGDDGAN